eukprot:TRINITY_DN1619_c0_g1_i2.p1 TRINITY_DN1619_c0_g1~~TRINITY_DN1619_c0_g1_i2.p1  ORF type:complete len:1787 (-),score=398.56 TRINITY_DN1619_c0_g1_i2:43-5403(-)
MTFIRLAAHPSTVCLSLKIIAHLLLTRPSIVNRFKSGHSNGYQVLEVSLTKYYDQPDIYYVIFALLLEKPINTIPSLIRFDLPQLAADFKDNRRVSAPEVLMALLGMLKRSLVRTLRSQHAGLARGRRSSIIAPPLDLETKIGGDVIPFTALSDDEMQEAIQLQSIVVDFLLHVHRNSEDLHEAWRRTEVLDPLVEVLFVEAAAVPDRHQGSVVVPFSAGSPEPRPMSPEMLSSLSPSALVTGTAAGSPVSTTAATGGGTLSPTVISLSAGGTLSIAGGGATTTVTITSPGTPLQHRAGGSDTPGSAVTDTTAEQTTSAATEASAATTEAATTTQHTVSGHAAGHVVGAFVFPNPSVSPSPAKNPRHPMNAGLRRWSSVGPYDEGAFASADTTATSDSNTEAAAAAGPAGAALPSLQSRSSIVTASRRQAHRRVVSESFALRRHFSSGDVDAQTSPNVRSAADSATDADLAAEEDGDDDDTVDDTVTVSPRQSVTDPDLELDTMIGAAVSMQKEDTPSRVLRTQIEMFTHPTSGLILRLLCDMCIKSLRQAKGFASIEAVLEAYPAGALNDVIMAYQGRIITDVMSELSRSLSRQALAEDTKLCNNVCRFCGLIVDKVYQGWLPFADRKVFEFLIDLLKVLDADSGKQPRMDSTAQIVYRSLNRMLMWHVSNPMPSDMDLIFILNSIVSNERVVFSSLNSDVDFVAIMCYHLHRLFLDDSADLREAACNIWKCMLVSKPQMLADVLVYKQPAKPGQGKPEIVDLLHGGFDLLIKQGFHQFSFWMGDHDNLIQHVFEETVKKTWTAHEAADARTRSEQRRASEQRIATRRQRHDKRLKIDAHKLTEGDERRISEYEEKKAWTRARMLRRKERVAENVVVTQQNWSRLVDEMTTERALFGSMVPEKDVRWMLDSTEGPLRMRRKLMRVSKFNPLLDNVPMRTSEASAPATPVTSISELSTATTAADGATANDSEDDVSTAVPKLAAAAIAKEQDKSFIDAPAQQGEDEKDEHEKDEKDEKEDEQDVEDQDDDLQLHRILETGERVKHRYNCARVAGMDKCDGILLLCTRNVYVIDNYKIDNETGDIVALHTAEEVASGVKRMRPTSSALDNGLNKWPYDRVSEVHKRRYLLRPVALELFADDGRNYLFVLNIDERDAAYRALDRFIKASLPAAGPQLGGVDVDTGTRNLWRRTITQRWQTGEISNFHYLMLLNTLAGRSYNDLTQYPVFPWVLSDYESETIDLSNVKFYRDLTLPMGALTEKRKLDFQMRYESWEDDVIPPFHYGTHYSSAAIVLYYMIRLAPFTQHAIALQGGHFDHADRMFHSIASTWHGASSANLADVKELIPEFFYFPLFLDNLNNYELGRKQTGELLQEVQLPPWCNGDMKEFVRLHRQALESDYVSQHLHEWIDLIFGFKQRGQAAIDNCNVFYYLTYEGKVDIDAIEDQTMREATIAQIHNFGQTPAQLFHDPHPKRTPAPLPMTVYSMCEMLQPSATAVREIGEPVGMIRVGNEKLLVVGLNKVCQPPRFHKYLSWGTLDRSVRTCTMDGDKLSAVNEDMHDGEVTCAAMSDDGRWLITGGSDTVVNVWSYHKTREERVFTLTKTLCAHVQPVTCVAVSQAYSVIVTGAEDGIVCVWDLTRLSFVRQLQHEAPITALAINDVSGDIITCSGHNLFLWSINGDPLAQNFKSPGSAVTAVCVSKGPEWVENNVVITVHKDGIVRIWSVNYNQKPVHVPTAPHGSAVRELYMRTQLAARDVTAVYLAQDQRRLYTGDVNGRVFLWTVPELRGV